MELWQVDQHAGNTPDGIRPRLKVETPGNRTPRNDLDGLDGSVVLTIVGDAAADPTWRDPAADRAQVRGGGASRYLSTIARGLLRYVAVLIAMFVLAGTAGYWQGWVYGGIGILFGLVIAVLFRTKRDLIEERVRPGPGMKGWDKLFMAFYVPSLVAILAVACLDAVRFQWTPRLSPVVYVGGYSILVASFGIILWAMWANRFFSSVVRIQRERGHHVVQAGPYRVVRHPGYVGVILGGLASAVVLGSLWALIPVGLTAALLVARTALEDATLRRELPGYLEYARKVQYRLLPGVW